MTRPEDERVASLYDELVSDDQLWSWLGEYAAHCSISKVDIERKYLTRHQSHHNGKVISALWRDRLSVETTPPAPQTREVGRLRRVVAAYEDRERRLDQFLRARVRLSVADVVGPPPVAAERGTGARVGSVATDRAPGTPRPQPQQGLSAEMRARIEAELDAQADELRRAREQREVA